MFLGALLSCVVMFDVRSCDIKTNTQTLFNSKQECQDKMRAAAQYAAQELNFIARPFCFSMKKNQI